MAEKVIGVFFDGSTGETVERELTAAEKAEIEKTSLDNEAFQAEAEAKIAARESALAKLAALGLTEEEIGAL
jgi:DNA-binding NarL/FixJ family response regulator